MRVDDFVEKFIEPNTLVRLWYKNEKGEYITVEEGDSVMMEWKLKNSGFKHKGVVGITDILYLKSDYIEAVNLVIE